MAAFIDHPWRQCEGKHTISSRARARTTASKMGSRTGRAYHAYKCPHCGWFHVGTAQRKRDAIDQQAVQGAV